MHVLDNNGCIIIESVDSISRDGPDMPYMQWRKKMLLNRGAVNKIVRKAGKNFLGHTICLQTTPIFVLIWL